MLTAGYDMHTPPPRARAFSQPIRVGQFNRPAWARYEAAMRDIFERRYYTNQGPLAQQFEERLQAALGVRHAVCVTNATIGVMMANEALGASGRVLLPAVCHRSVEHAFAWCRIETAFCDVDPASGHISADHARAVLEASAQPFAALVAANLWGRRSDTSALASVAGRHRAAVLVDSLQAFGCATPDARPASRAPLEVFEFGDADLLYAAGAACIATDDDELAARLRNIRSSYGAGRPVPVVKTSNGRMSEAQAALGLLGLDEYATHRARNAALAATYCRYLKAIAGIRVVEPAGAANHQAFVVEIDEAVYGLTRDALTDWLAADNVELKAVRASTRALSNRAMPLPAADRIDRTWAELPIGAALREADVVTICELIAAAPARVAQSQEDSR